MTCARAVRTSVAATTPPRPGGCRRSASGPGAPRHWVLAQGCRNLSPCHCRVPMSRRVPMPGRGPALSWAEGEVSCDVCPELLTPCGQPGGRWPGPSTGQRRARAACCPGPASACPPGRPTGRGSKVRSPPPQAIPGHRETQSDRGGGPLLPCRHHAIVVPAAARPRSAVPSPSPPPRPPRASVHRDGARVSAPPLLTRTGWPTACLPSKTESKFHIYHFCFHGV